MGASARNQAKARRIVELFRIEIANLPEGTKLLSRDALSERFGVSRGVAELVFQILKEEKLACSYWGSGTYRTGERVPIGTLSLPSTLPPPRPVRRPVPQRRGKAHVDARNPALAARARRQGYDLVPASKGTCLINVRLTRPVQACPTCN